MTQRSLLIVEDDRTTRKALRAYYQRKGWEVREASTVAEGLTQLDPPPDCLILDLMLPDQSGEVVLRKIREERLPTRVIVCTGSVDSDMLDTMAALGPDALLFKPIEIDDLSRACGAF